MDQIKFIRKAESYLAIKGKQREIFGVLLKKIPYSTIFEKVFNEAYHSRKTRAYQICIPQNRIKP